MPMDQMDKMPPKSPEQQAPEQAEGAEGLKEKIVATVEGVKEVADMMAQVSDKLPEGVADRMAKVSAEIDSIFAELSGGSPEPVSQPKDINAGGGKAVPV